MRNFLGFLLLVPVAATIGTIPALPGPQPFSITIGAQHDLVKAGSEVLVQITLTNTSNHEIALGKAPGDLPQAESEYSIDVRDRKGQPAPDTDYGRKIKEKKIIVSISRVSCELQPGGSLKDGAIITKLYDLSRPDTYAVQVSRIIPTVFGKGVVKSNTIEITVTP